MGIKEAVYAVNEISDRIQSAVNDSLRIVVPNDTNVIRTFVRSTEYITSQASPGKLLASFTATVTGVVRFRITWKSENSTSSPTYMTLDLRKSDDGYTAPITLAQTRSKTEYETAVVDIGITAGSAYKLYFVHPGTYSGTCNGLVMLGTIVQRDPNTIITT